MNLTREEIGAILKKLRLGTGMTQCEVAERLGRRQQIIGHWETGYAQPDLNTFFQLCALYQADISSAFGCAGESSTVTTQEDLDLLSAYRMATANEHELIDIILKKYRSGTAISLLNSLYSEHVDRWFPPDKKETD